MSTPRDAQSPHEPDPDAVEPRPREPQETEPPPDPLRLAQQALADGRREDAIDHWKELSSSSGERDPDRLARWLLLLVEAGAPDLAADILPRLDGTPWAKHARQWLDDDNDDEDLPDDDDTAPDPAILRLENPTADQRVLDLFIQWFAGRADVHARQWYDERRRRGGYRLVEAPLTRKVARDHLDGRLTIGQYLLWPDGSCSFGVIDLDLSAAALETLHTTIGPDAAAIDDPDLRDFGKRIRQAARRLGVPLFPEDSGGRGLHLWIFFRPRKPARAVRALLGQLVAAAGPQPAHIGVEIFPKQDRTGPRGLSALVKLPLGLHQKTLRRCHLLTPELQPITDPLEALQQLAAAPTDRIDDIIGHRLVALPTPSLPKDDGPPPPIPGPNNAVSLARAIRSIEPGEPTNQACERVIQGCVVLRTIVDKAFEQRRLDPAEARAVTYTLGLIGTNPQIVDEVFMVSGAPRKELERARRGLSAPSGCKRLRRLGLVRPTDCPCPLPDKAHPYPTPVLLALGAQGAPPAKRPGYAEWLDSLPDPGVDPIVAIARTLERIERRLDRIDPDGRSDSAPNDAAQESTPNSSDDGEERHER